MPFEMGHVCKQKRHYYGHYLPFTPFICQAIFARLGRSTGQGMRLTFQAARSASVRRSGMPADSPQGRSMTRRYPGHPKATSPGDFRLVVACLQKRSSSISRSIPRTSAITCQYIPVHLGDLQDCVWSPRAASVASAITRFPGAIKQHNASTVCFASCCFASCFLLCCRSRGCKFDPQLAYSVTSAFLQHQPAASN